MISSLSENAFVRQLGKFGLVGLTATAVHSVTFVIAVELSGAPPLIANLVAFLVAFGVSFFGNYRWTFRSEPSSLLFARFLVTSFVGLAINTTGVWLVVDLGNLPSAYALPVFLFVAPLTVFLLSKSWVFRPNVD